MTVFWRRIQGHGQDIWILTLSDIIGGKAKTNGFGYDIARRAVSPPGQDPCASRLAQLLDERAADTFVIDEPDARVWQTVSREASKYSFYANT
mmetsp:Transcript_67816/g.107535  ORF Transcript_67816/g.107535 Transcript_67816/m.107535 type:complete len:93 (+) Transcript_67816:967-1245(+)